MKRLSMAISSPVGPEKFPTPSRKFSRSKSSISAPVFRIRGRRNAAGMIETGNQEPYSPKVTCIGQVRPRKSGRRRRWLLGKLLPRFRRVLWKWAALFRSGYCKRVDAEKGCLRKMEALGGKFENFLECSAPRNGLVMLRRCGRSAPYRALSLGERFWRENGDDEVLKNLGCGDVAATAVESRIPQECLESTRNNVSVGDKLEGGMVMHPLMLTRCRSEPARSKNWREV